ncbi:winged helix-turn-helix domain-containing protein [Haloarcula marina]|uniref:winged helix-turn-helix domain-containing protein n=1 Tax=Haloarcula marina TaxID=2961574 RepID=UPI0020B8258B|nr:winged helix-turn-helix domain-containing protein [Halomicroarcula marina]
MTNSDPWDKVSYVISSRYRIATLQRLSEGPATPSLIADETDLSIAHVSRALQELRDNDLVRLLVSEDRRKGRVYGITDAGLDVWQTIETENMV